MEPGEVKKYYQYQAGSRKGEVEVYLADGEKEVYFESGRSVTKETFQSVMIEIPESAYNQKSGNKESRESEIAKWQSMLGNDQPTEVTQSPSKSPPPKKKEPIKEQNPIDLILSKQKKVKKKPWSITVELPIPEDKVLEFLTMMFDEDEVYDSVVDFAFTDISIDNIKSEVKNQLVGGKKKTSKGSR